MAKQFVLVDQKMLDDGIAVEASIVKFLGKDKKTVFNSMEEVKEAALQSELKGTFRVATREVSPWEYAGEVML